MLCSHFTHIDVFLFNQNWNLYFLQRLATMLPNPDVKLELAILEIIIFVSGHSAKVWLVYCSLWKLILN